ncbi:MAG: hypothetical protein IIZ33_00470 [Erysipelotrichaceae bacterium]|nr:hypothetical protein [Erysipelotrichaceae bacterium]
MKFNVKSVIILILATVCVGICVVDLVYASLGSDSLTVFEEGLAHLLNAPIGVGTMTYNIVAIVLCILFARKHIGWATIANALLVGVSVSLTEPLLLPFVTMSDSLLFRCLIFALGLFFCALGCALLIYGGAGMNTLDALCTTVSDKTGLAFKYVRIIADAILMLAGYLMGGKVSVGSLVCILTVGPLISWMADLLKKTLK